MERLVRASFVSAPTGAAMVEICSRRTIQDASITRRRSPIRVVLASGNPCGNSSRKMAATSAAMNSARTSCRSRKPLAYATGSNTTQRSTAKWTRLPATKYGGGATHSLTRTSSSSAARGKPENQTGCLSPSDGAPCSAVYSW
jgi:hypothetical protein